MLPKFLYGTYKRYRDDTSALINYLIETAKKCGHEAAEQSILPANGQSGKASKTSPEGTNRRIALKQLSALARTVAESTLEVSPVIIAEQTSLS
jgi:hypothetical protein